MKRISELGKVKGIWLLALLLPVVLWSCGEKEDQVLGIEQVDQAPAFQGELTEYIQNNLTYPEQAKTDSLSGMVRVRFVVDDYGNTERIKVTESLSPACDSAVVLMVRNMPQWEPATLDDFPVRVWVEIPVQFGTEESLPAASSTDSLSAQE